MNEPSEPSHSDVAISKHKFSPKTEAKIERLVARGHMREDAELVVREAIPDCIGDDPPPPIPWDDPEVAAILDADTDSQYTDAEAAVALRANSAHLTPAELAEFICKAQGEPLIPMFVEGYLGRAFPAVPKEKFKAVRTWSRYGGKPGTLTDAEFNAILQPYIGPSAKPAP